MWLGIYRCTYGGNEAWNLFKQIVVDNMHESITDSPTSEIHRRLSRSLEINFFEDETRLMAHQKLRFAHTL